MNQVFQIKRPCAKIQVVCRLLALHFSRRLERWERPPESRGPSRERSRSCQVKYPPHFRKLCTARSPVPEAHKFRGGANREKLSPEEATRKSMRQISGALVAVGVVLSAVFIPMAFLERIILIQSFQLLEKLSIHNFNILWRAARQHQSLGRQVQDFQPFGISCMRSCLSPAR